MSRTVAVTGATGFIGRALVLALTANGWRVRALRHTAVMPSEGDEDAVQWVTGALEDIESLRYLLQDVDAVVHCAGAVRGISAAQFDRVNEQGVENLLAAALAQETPPRFLSLSSLAAREPGLSYYAASKYKGEMVLLAAGDRIPWIVLRPPAVYGPGDRELLPLFRLMAKGIAPLPGADASRFSLIYVDDLVRALILCLERRDIPMGRYELDDGHPGGYCWKEIVQTIEAQCHRSVRRIAIPLWLLAAVAGVNSLLARMRGVAPMLTSGKVRELAHRDWVCDSTDWRRVSGWAPQISFAEGVRRTLGNGAPPQHKPQNMV